MQFKYVSGSLASVEAHLLAVAVYTDGNRDAHFKQLDKALGGLLTERLEERGFKGGAGELVMVRVAGDAVPARAVAVIGAGDRAAMSSEALKDLAATAVKAAAPIAATTVAIAVPAGAGRDAAHVAHLLALGADLATYRFDKYRAEASRKPSTVKTTTIVGSAKPGAAISKALRAAGVVASAVMAARDFVNEPAAVMTPRRLADEARAIAKRHKNVSVKILTPAECQKLGMNMFLAVGQGSDEEVRLIHLTYSPAKRARKRIAFIGKGVTFDSGGYSLKPSSAMLDMKIDMAGSAAVIAAMDAIATLGSPHEVHAIAACAENLVSGRAYKLGDVLTAMNGKTVEINNTDAEGRLTLGDALTYAREKVKPDEMVDMATLTGACLVALGPNIAGVMSTDDKMCKAWLAAAERSGEEMWHLPLPPKLREQLKSPIADMKNTGGRSGGALTAGLFLREFVGDTPWVHVDIAGPASSAKDAGATPEGGTGYCVATIVEYSTR